MLAIYDWLKVACSDKANRTTNGIEATLDSYDVRKARDETFVIRYLLAVIWRSAGRRSDLVVLDAGSVQDGPIAAAELSGRVPFGFHGKGVPSS